MDEETEIYIKQQNDSKHKFPTCFYINTLHMLNKKTEKI